MDLHALQPGYMLREYRIEKLLGEGGFGLTYLAFDTNLDKNVAIKEYMPSEHAVRNNSKIIAKSQASKTVYEWGLNAFLNEAKTLAKFEAPNIVSIYRYFKANGTAYIVMEYCEGGCLIDRISKDVHMNEEELKHILSSLAHGLQLVHNDGILHRDIKPDNIMFRQNGTPVLIDFGAARQAIGDKSRKVTTIITPGYAPLEQYSSKGSLGPWSDIYSLSAVGYLCLTGNRPPDIMNRLHEDTIEKLSARVNSSAFLRSIDLGLELQVDDRPKNLSEWSSSWSQLSTSCNEFSLKKEANQPIYASKQISRTASNHSISARNSIESYEQTIVNSNSLPFNSKTSHSAKPLLFIVTLLILAGAFYFAYDYYTNQQLQQKIKDSERDQEELIALNIDQQQMDLVLNVQQILNKLGYKVPENGTADTRTTESIKLFEKASGMIVTGQVDTTLLKELKKSIENNDTNNWKKAKKQNTVTSYKAYLASNPKGEHAWQAQSSIDSIENQVKLVDDKKKQELIEAELTANINEENRINLKERRRLQQIANEKNQLVRKIQLQLIRLKYKSLPTTGKIDRSTKNAIKTFQRLNNIEINGLPTKTLLFSLKNEKKWSGRMPGETLKECDNCPTMIVIPAGLYKMGSNNGKSNEKPVHHVAIDEFILSTTEITFKHWQACVSAQGCTHNPKAPQSNSESVAVMRINHDDALQYIQWLNSFSKHPYRLPSESEWEYAARAGSTTEYSWGNEIGTHNVSCNGCNMGYESEISNQIKKYLPNAYGLYDMHGNLWEWVADCWHYSYEGAPSDNEAWEPNDCQLFVTRGGSGSNAPKDLRSAQRNAVKPEQRNSNLGFRIAMDSD